MVRSKNCNSTVGARSLVGAAVLYAGFVSVTPVMAQTVVLGGSGANPVTVNMGVLNPQYSVPSIYTRGTANTATDYSKPGRIVFGNEVIQLTPPGSKPKKSRSVAAKRSKPAAPKITKPTVAKIAPVKAEPAPKAAPVEDVKVTKAVAPAPVATAKPVQSTPAPVTTAAKAADKPAMTAPEKKAEASAVKMADKVAKPEAVVETKMAAAPAAPAAVAEKPKEMAPKAPAAPVEKPAAAQELTPKKEMQVASVAPEIQSKPVAPTAPSVQPSGISRILFESSKSGLPSGATAQLKKMASTLKNEQDRVQLLAYADGTSNGAARRLSLGRALAVRSELMALGVPNNKIEVRALGKPNDGLPADRVDMKLIAR